MAPGEARRHPLFLGKDNAMCRSIKTLRKMEPPATDDEIEAAALQFVRKVSGYRKPSRLNEAAFETAVDEIASATRKLLSGLVSRP